MLSEKDGRASGTQPGAFLYALSTDDSPENSPFGRRIDHGRKAIPFSMTNLYK
jgi:hypothetical protein